MTSGVTKLRTGVVLIADDASLCRLGPTTALAAAVERTRALTLADEILLVTDSEEVRRLAVAWEISCLRWQDVGPVVWSQAAEPRPNETEEPGAPARHSTRADGSGWPRPPEGSVPPPSRFSLTGTEIVPRAVGIRANESTSALWAGLRLDVAVFVDVACPLWDVRDLEAVVTACSKHCRVFLAAELGPAWTRDAGGGVVEVQGPVCGELSTLRGYRLRGDGEAPHALVVPSYKGWSLRDPMERLGIEAAWARSKSQERVSRLPRNVGALVMDFDGVHTDNRVYVDQEGRESVACNRGDGLGLELLRKSGVPLLVLSKERNPVIRARCEKLQIPFMQGVDDKLTALQRWADERNVAARDLVYVGNDVNDLECIRWVGCGVAVADSHPEVIAAAHLVLERDGGAGALRELCELITLRHGVRMPATTD